MEKSKYFDKEIIYSYNAGDDLYFLKGFEDIISIYYREYGTSNQFGTISSENPKFQTVKMLLKRNNLSYNEGKDDLWFSFRPKIVSVMERENETTPLDKIESGYFAPFNLYSKGRIYRFFQFSSKEEKMVSDRLLAMNYVINNELDPSYFRIDYIGKQRGIKNFLQSYGYSVKFKGITFSYETDMGSSSGYFLILPGSEDCHLLTDRGIIGSQDIEGLSEIHKGINSIWENIHKVPLEMSLVRKEERLMIDIIMEEEYVSHFLLQLRKMKLKNIRVENLGNIS